MDQNDMKYTLFIQHLKKGKNIYKVFLLWVSLVFTACSTQDEAPSDRQPNNNNVPINYLALGDSYTIGQGVEESDRWPNQLGEKLRENGFVIHKIDIIARTGWTTSNLLNALDTSDSYNYNLVSLLIGVNNQYQNQPFEIFTVEFDSLLHRSIDMAGGAERVFVLSIPDYGVTPFGSNNSEYIAQEIDKYNDYIRQRCMERNIPFIDITEISRQMGDSQGSLAEDQLHPSGIQYTRWVEKVLPLVTDIVSK